MNGPSNRELFEFLANDLAFSVFVRSGESLRSFKGTIEFAFAPEGTEEGPPEGLLYEGVARLSYGDWLEFVAGFAMTSVESRHADGGAVRRTYHAHEDGSGRLHLLAPQRESAAELDAATDEELISERARYVWTGAGREPGNAGQVAVHARQIACRGADSGMSARALLCEKLAQYRRRRR